MDVGVTIAEYKKHLKALGYAESSIDAYSRYLDLFGRYLEACKITDLRKVTRQVILAYQEKIMTEPIAIESKALKIRPVKRLFEHLTDTHRLLINPTENIVETCRKNRNIQPVLTVAEMKRMLAQPDLSSKSDRRDRALMELLYSTGIRLDELVNVKIHDVDLKGKVLYVRKGKGRKQRVLPLGKNAALSLKEYLQEIRPRYARKNRKERSLFLDRSGQSLSKGAIRQAIRKYRLAAKINKPVSPHTFRRSCATHLLQQGADIRYIQKLLGHSSLKTTQMYTKVMPVEVKKTHDQTHPNSKKEK